VGNDTNDLACFPLVGCPAVPADAHVLAKDAAKIVLSSTGGNGAVREICELVVRRLQSAR
jgi:3-deoxy-D-manno-octulosonate 8-phosphate phosphatase KdsC-like HAD superfamily phosphatase